MAGTFARTRLAIALSREEVVVSAEVQMVVPEVTAGNRYESLAVVDLTIQP